MKIYEGDSVPELESPKCSVIQCDVKTGIVLTLNGRRKVRDETFILIFDSFELATEFAKAKVLENAEIECSIYDYQGKYISTISANEL